MAVRVRLTRVGSKKNAMWRVVVADQRSPRDGRFIEMIGHYNPQTQPSQIVIDRERLDHWLEQGAQPTNTVRKLMRAPNTVASDVASPESDSEAPADAEAPAREAPASGEAPAPEEAAAPEPHESAGEAAAEPEAEAAPEPEASEEPDAAADAAAGGEEAADDKASGS
jgi:small subunit ribosomal protein S16